MPKELICTAPLKLEFRDYEETALTGNQIRIRSINSAAKHGTEMQWFAGKANHRGRVDSELGIFVGSPEDRSIYPNRVGNMFVGEVIELGPDVSESESGDIVFSHGPFRETQTQAEDRCRKLPEGMSWKSAVCIDPAEFALGAVRDGHVRPGDFVVTFGMGALGLMVVQVAKLAGAKCIVSVDPLPNRREAARACGADILLNPLESDIGIEIRKLTNGRGADVCIDYSGRREALQQALRSVALGGNVVLGAAPGLMDAGLDLGAEAHKNTPNIIFSRACTEPNREYPRWTNRRIIDTCFDWLASGKLSGECIIDPVVPFESLVEEYPKVVTDMGSNIKLGVQH
jgi:threonine dehydrogenase-like Zn-dependent dehydrogenase